MIPKRKLEFLLDKVKEQCKSCKGAGCTDCKSKSARYSMYARIGIPVDYWKLSFKNFVGDQNFKKQIHKKISDTNEMYNNGKSLAFVGGLGTGKTYMACCIIKRAAIDGFSSKYYHMNDIIKNTLNNSDFFDEITNIDFICIDEYDERWVFPSERSEQLFGQTMESILRVRFSNQMPTIICSNTPDITKVLSGTFSKSTKSLFSEYVEVIYVTGKDFRRL